MQIFVRKRGFTLSKSKGFTLIELLVVIAIIGLLSGIVLVSMTGVRSKGRDAKRQSDIRQIVTAQQLVMSDDEQFRQNLAVTGALPAIQNNDTPPIVYMPSVSDPKNTAPNLYTWVDNTGAANSQKFCAYAVLEKAPATAGNTVYFCASDQGVREEERAALAGPPTLADCCAP